MFFLGHEHELRARLQLPPAKQLWGADVDCLWPETPSVPGDLLTAVLYEPDRALEGLGLSGGHALTLFDELLVHGRFVAAQDLAVYLAFISCVVPRGAREPRQDLRLPIFFLQKAALAAIEGGYYGRASAVLVQAHGLLQRLPPSEDAALCEANNHLLRGRLSQLLELSDESMRQLTAAERRFPASLGRPAGLELIQLRSRLRPDPAGVGRALGDLSPPNREDWRSHLLGGFAEYYYEYLLARVALRVEDWADAVDAFGRAQGALSRSNHRGHPDPVRTGYILMGRGTALVEQGHEVDSRPGIDKGLRLLIEARAQFRSHDFAPGEYVAYAEHIRLQRKTHESAVSPVQLYRELQRVARRARVPLYMLEAGYSHAHALSATGRLNAANVAAQEVKQELERQSPGVLATHRLWRKLDGLLTSTGSARDNAVEPDAPWGMSTYATQECEDVRKVVRLGCLVSVHGPAGSGRRLLLARIHEARKQPGTLWLIDRQARSATDPVADAERLLRAGEPVLLHDLDTWPQGTQHALVSLLQANPTWSSRAYATLTESLEATERVAPSLANLLAEGTFDIEPLTGRRPDRLLLARGLLVRGLIGKLGDRDRAKDYFFTGDALTYIDDRYSTVGDLNRAMRLLAVRMHPERDVIIAGDGRFRVPAETIRKYLPASRSLDDRSHVSTARMTAAASALGPEELRAADAAMVRSLRHEFHGNLRALAAAYGIKRPTLIRHWTKTGVIDEWRGVASRRPKGKSR